MSAPILTYETAEAWASERGLSIDLSIHRSATHPTPLDAEAAFVALVENLRAQVESDVVPLADAPRCAHCVERERRVDDLRAVLGRLVGSLPKCTDCDRPQTVETDPPLCDSCSERCGDLDDLTYADALRAALAVLGRAT